MKKNGKKYKKIIFFIGVVLIFLISYIFLIKYKEYNQTNIYKPPLSKTYKSDLLNYEFTIPETLSITEADNSIYLKKGKGQIAVDRVGTNFDSLEGYLDNLEARNKITINNREYIKINNLNSIKAILQYPISKTKEEKIYVIYVDYWVYSLSTSSTDLYDELDQIAQSFQYVP